MSAQMFDKLFDPLIMSNLTLKNRFFMAPMGTGFNMETMIDYLIARAKGGVALITSGETSVHPGGRAGLKNELIIEKDKDIKLFSVLTKKMRDNGAKIVLQLNHAGRYSPGKAVGGQSVAPSPIISGYTGETPRELTTGEVDNLIIAFSEAALRAKKADFDGVELLGSSGYLISQFLSPITNHRKDKYGGDTFGRLTFVLSIIREIRNLVGNDFNICVKFDADDGMRGGVTLNESRTFAAEFVKAGADRIHIWVGWHESTRPMLPMSVPRGAFSKFAVEIKNIVSVPVSTVGRINDPYTAAQILKNGEADLIGLGRALLADPDFVIKTREGRVDEIRKCTACCYCFDKIIETVRNNKARQIQCSINPELGREGENLIKKADKSKNIVVVGGGPAGMEVARLASMRGHKVTLYEKDKMKGGMLNYAFLPPHKKEIENIVDYYSFQMELQKINVKHGIQFSSDNIRQENPDAVILATGVKTLIIDIPGISTNHVVSAMDVLSEKEVIGNSVIVIGGGMIGLETAEYLADRGREVIVLEKLKIAPDVGPSSRWGLISRLREKIKILSSTQVIEIFNRGVIVLVREKNRKEIFADTIVAAAGMDSDRELEKEIAKTGVEYFLVGSCKNPGMVKDAINDAFTIGCMI